MVQWTVSEQLALEAPLPPLDLASMPGRLPPVGWCRLQADLPGGYGGRLCQGV